MRSKLALFALLALLIIFVGCIILLWGRASRSALLDAAEEGDLPKVQALLKGGRAIDERDSRIKFGWTPLIAAIYQGNTNVVHYLIASGANVNLPDNSGETPLMWATARGDGGLDIVKDLISHGADVNAKDGMGASVVSYASSDPPKPMILEIVKAAIAGQEKKTNQ